MARIALPVVIATAVIAVAVLAYALDPPHDWNTISVPPNLNEIDCSDCHKPHAAAGGAITVVAGNANLCQTCHRSGGLAQNKPMVNTDQAFPSPGLSSWTSVRGTSHRWDSGASGHVKADDVTPNKATGTVQSSGAFTGRYSKTYTVTITTSGNVGTAYFSWTATTPPGGSGASTLIQTSATPGVSTPIPLDEGINVTFNNGASPATCGFSFCVNDKWRVYVRTDINQPSTAAMAARISEGKIMCSTCHNQHSQSEAPFDPSAPAYGGAGTGAGRHFQRVADDTVQMCLDCHSARNKGSLSGQTGNLTHPIGLARSIWNGLFNARASITLPLDKGADGIAGNTDDRIQCLSCHQPHYAASSDGALLRMADVTTLCNNCHTLADTSTPASHLNTSTGVLWPGPGTAPNGPYGSTTFPQVTDPTKRGACTNCHQPHGWPDGASPGQDYAKLLVEQPDQRLCYVCHDANGPAISNVYAQFNGTTNYQTTAMDGAKVNQRHDVTAADQTYSGGSVACTNCHDPHLATAANRVIDPDTPATKYTQTYSKTNSYTRSGYNFTYDGSGSDLDPMNPLACKVSTQGKWAIGWPGIPTPNSGNDTAVSGGTYNDAADALEITYTVTVTTGGAFGTARITVASTSNRDNSGPTTVTANHTAVAVGTRGVTITFHDPSRTGAALTANDKWTITVSRCATSTEPDMVTFCLVCHDNNPPPGVVMSPSLVNVAAAFRDQDQHGRIAGNNGANGFMKSPWNDNNAGAELPNPYAALQCTTCHDGHGSANIFHLKTSITVRGIQMRIGGGQGSGFEPGSTVPFSKWGAATYVLPCFTGGGTTLVDCSTAGSTQLDHKWGAFCTFCHTMETHGQAEDATCRTGHRHGGGAF